jgi:hypothetical protein
MRMSQNSELYEANTHVFMTKIWLEESADQGEKARWRGHITYISTGERRYIESLYDVIAFIRPYLEGMGVKTNLTSRIGEWLGRLSADQAGRG